MSLSSEIENLYTEEASTWEKSWSVRGLEPDPKDKFWKFRPPSIDPEKDRFGSFHYNLSSLEELEKPLTISEMVELYYDLGKRNKQEGANHLAFQAEKTLLALDIMEVVSSRVQKVHYPKIVAEELAKDRNLTVSGAKNGDLIYREASLVYPSGYSFSKMYVKGQVYVPEEDRIKNQWIGPHEVMWKKIDTSKRRSGIFVETEEGPTYYWWFDSLAAKVGYAANKIQFKPDIEVSGYKGLIPVIKGRS